MKRKIYFNKVVFTFIIVFAALFVNNFCHSEANRIKQEIKSVENYSKIFADYRLTSMQDRVVKASGKLHWFLPSENSDFPRLILYNESELLVKYGYQYQIFKDKNVVFKGDCDFGPNIIFSDQSVLFSENATVKLFDRKNQEEQDICIVPDIISESIWKGIYKFDENIFVQILNRASEESNLVFPKSDDNTSNQDDYSDKSILLVIDSNQKVRWRKEFNGESLPSVILTDSKQVLSFYYEDPYSNSISVFDLETGRELNKIKVEKAAVINASLDFNNQLNVILHTSENEFLLRNYSLQGNVNWEYLFSVTALKSISQPPAINKLNQVFCIINNMLYGIDEGRLIFETNLLDDNSFKYVTITGDNNIIVCTLNVLSYFKADGTMIFNYILEPTEKITTPVVIDENGLIYFGSTKGIYSLK